MKSPRYHRRLSPLALAALLALGGGSLNAAPRSFAGPGSFWDVVANWTGGIVPGAADDALLGAFNTEVRTTFTILSFAGTGTLTVSGGTLTTSAASTTVGFTLSGSGTLAGTGAVAITGAGSWTAGTMTGTGVTTASGTFAFSGASVKDLTAGRTLATSGSTTWTNTANDNGRIRTGAGATINNSGSWDDQQAFNGAVSPDFGGSANFNNTGSYTKSGAGTTTFGIAFNNTSSGAGTGVVAVNAGGLRLTGGGSSNGSFAALAGTTLAFGGGYTLQAASSVNSAGTVEFAGSGNNTVAGSYSAATSSVFSGGTTTFSGNVTTVGASLVANGGTAVFNNAQALTTTSVTASSGGLTFNNTGGLSATTLTLSGGTLAGTSTASFSGNASWTSGTMTGTGRTQVAGAMTISGASVKDLTAGRTLGTAGTTTWTNTAANTGRIRTGGAAVIDNSGSWLDQQAFDSGISPDFGGTATFVNRGSYTKSGAGTTTIAIAFDNNSTSASTGVVAVNAGSLFLNAGGSSNGSFTGAAGTTLGFGGGHTLAAGSSVDTAGTVDFTGNNTVAGSFNAGTSTRFSGGTSSFTGTVTGVGSSIVAAGGTGVFNNTQAFAVSALQLSSGGLTFNNTGGVTTSTLSLTGGTLGGSSDVSVSGATTWTSGTMTGAGRTLANGALTLSGASVKDLTGGRTLIAGDTTWTNTANTNGRIRTGGSALIRNTGTWADQQAFDSGISPDFGGTARFENLGTYTKSGAGTTSIGIAFDNTTTTPGSGVVNVNAGTLALGGGGSSNGSFQGTGTLVFNGGVYELLAGSSVTNPNVQFSGGTVNVGGSYSVSGNTTVSGGTANFTGTVAGSGGNLVLSNGTANFSNLAGVSVATLTQSSGTLSGTQDLTVTGATTWTGGTMTGAGRTLADGTLVLSGSAVKDLTGGRRLAAASTTWTNTANTNGRIRTGGSALITNTGTWADQLAFDGGISPDFGGSARFANQGTYDKTGAGTTNIAIAFDNTRGVAAGSGVVNVNAGTLVLSGGGSSSGSFQGTGLLDFGGGVHELLAASSVTNPNVRFSGGTTNLGGSYNVSGTTTVNGGTANFTGSVANSGGNLVVSSGAANFSNLAGVTVSTLALSGGTVGGTQSLTVSGDASWTGGTMNGSGSTTVQGALSLSGSSLKDLTGGRVLNADGSTTWANTAASNGRIRTGGGAVINNNGSWADQQAFNGQISADFGGTSTFNNIGSYTKSGAGTTDIAIGFVNGTAAPGSGVVNLNTGTLQLSGGGSSTGTFNLADGTTLQFSGGSFSLGGSVASAANGRVLVSGGTVSTTGSKSFAGLLELTGATLNVNGDASAARYQQSGGTRGGSGSLTVSGSALWTGGSVTGAGSSTFNGPLELSGGGLKDLFAGHAFNTAGTTTWTNTAASNGRIRTGSAVAINNSGSWLDQQAFNSGISPDLGAGGSFNNSGSYTKSGAAITDMGVAFVNGTAVPGSGVVNLNAGTLQLSGGGSNLGSFNIADGATLHFSNSTYTLGGTVASAANGRVLVSSGTVNTAGSKSFAGLLELSGGALNVNAAATAARYTQSSGTLGGSGDLAISGSATWTAGTMTGPGSTTSNGTLALSGGGIKDLTAGRTLNSAGTTTWTNIAASTGRIRTGGAVVINNSGSWLDQLAFGSSISPDLGAGARFDNSGNYTKTGAGTTDISIAFSNPGRLSVSAGVLNLTGGLSNFAGSTLTGGTFEVIGNSTLRFTGANVVTNAATLLLDGAGSALLNATNNANALAGFATNAAAGSFSIRNGRNFTSAGAFGNAGIVNVGAASSFTAGGAFTNQATAQLQLAGGSFAGPSLANAGVTSGFGSVAPAVSNTGTVRANGGILALTGGVQGATGTVQVDAGATLSLGAGSSAGNLLHNGTLLALGTSNITVFNDYDNASFGVGNAFDRRGGVSGSGQILAAGTVQQTLSGALVSGGDTASATLTLPNIRVGLGGISTDITIHNVGLGGPALRGALVTTGISNPGLTGSGVTAQNWGAVAQGGPGQTFSIRFDPGFGQALSGQVLQVVNNFDNVAGQTLAITGQAFNLASASAAAPSPVVLANQREGGTLSQALTLSNLAPANGFSEGLDASISASGTALASGSFSLLAAGASSSALQVAVDTSTAGAKSGVATIALASNGAGTSGFGALGIATQTVDVSGNVYRLATASAVAPSPVVLANQRVGGTLTQALTLSNTAAADGFSEGLNASITASGTATAGGSFSLLAAGGSSNALFVGVDTATAGAKSGVASIALASDGTGTSGFAPLGITGQTVDVSGNVYRLATASAVSPSPVVLANQRVGGTATQLLTITNTAAADGFSEGLNASITASGTATAGGSFSVLAAGASSNALFVGVDTATAGAKSGVASIALASDGTGTSGFAPLGITGQTVDVSGNVYRLAQASTVIPNVVLLGNQREGGTLTQALTLSNLAAADGFSESLNASISGSSGILTGGSFVQLAAGSSSNSLFVGVDASTAGAKSGTATITLASDGTGSSGLGTFGIGTQTVNVNANVFRLASASTAAPSPVVLANQRVGGTLTQALTLANTAAADSFSEALNASIAAQGAATAGGAISLLAAGGSSNALFVGVDTTTAGAKSGSATITLSSDGSGSSGLGSFALGTQSVTVTGDVYRLAQASAATPASVSLADQRVGGSLTQAITLANTAAADGFSERLNGSIAASGSATAGGSFALLAAGASSSALFVGVDTSSAGAKSGTATITLASDGAGTSGFAAEALASQQVAVSGNVYRLAQPLVDATPLTLVARVGDAAVARSIAVSNAAPDLFTERLNASIASAPAGITAGPALVGLAPNASGSLGLSLGTGNAGNFSGTATVALVSSSAGTSSGAPDAALGSVDVAVSARVYAPAVAQLASTVVDFGTVRVGDVIAPRSLTLTNAASGALTDTLQATLSGGDTVFSASGTLAGLAAGASDASALQVQMATGRAGVFGGSATLALNSQNPELADQALIPLAISLQGQVNNLANAVLAQAGGAGSFSGAAFSYTLDFGTLQLGSGTLVSSLSLANAVGGPADALSGSWDLSALTLGDAFTAAGFGSFANLTAGSTLGGLSISFDTANAGSFDRTLVFNGLSVNGSGPDLALPQLTLQLHGSVAAVPEPQTWGMMLGGLLAMGLLSRRRLQARAG